MDVAENDIGSFLEVVALHHNLAVKEALHIVKPVAGILAHLRASGQILARLDIEDYVLRLVVEVDSSLDYATGEFAISCGFDDNLVILVGDGLEVFVVLDCGRTLKNEVELLVGENGLALAGFHELVPDNLVLGLASVHLGGDGELLIKQVRLEDSTVDGITNDEVVSLLFCVVLAPEVVEGRDEEILEGGEVYSSKGFIICVRQVVNQWHRKDSLPVPTICVKGFSPQFFRVLL